MTSFKEYIQWCISQEKDTISVELGHLESVTFDDICVLIHLITTEDKKVFLSKEVKMDLCYDGLDNSHIIELKNTDNCEELAILEYFSVTPTPYIYSVHLQKSNYINGELMSTTRYKMSPKFIQVAKKYKINNYPLTRQIISVYNIPYEYNTQRAKMWFSSYMNMPKSARNTTTTGCRGRNSPRV